MKDYFGLTKPNSDEKQERYFIGTIVFCYRIEGIIPKISQYLQ